MSPLGIIIAVVSTVGIGGAIALAFLAPLLARELLQVVLSTLGAIWKTRTGCAVLTAAACLTFGLYYFDHVGASRVQRAWDAAKAEAALKTVTADANIATRAKAKEDRDSAAEETADAANAKARNAYIAELEKRAASVCVDSDADIKRLQSIR